MNIILRTLLKVRIDTIFIRNVVTIIFEPLSDDIEKRFENCDVDIDAWGL